MTASRSNTALTLRITQMLREALEQGATVEIDGLGKFVPGASAGIASWVKPSLGYSSPTLRKTCPK